MIETEDTQTILVIPPPLPRALRIYEALDVKLSYQNFGSAWLCVLRGKTEDIELVFNGLFNWGATNGECYFVDHSQTVATFWSSEEQLTRFFYNIYSVSSSTRYKGRKANLLASSNKIAALKESCHEIFLRFDDGVPEIFAEGHSLGHLTAEKPDDDFRDAAWRHVAQKENDGDVEKAIDSQTTNE